MAEAPVLSKHPFLLFRLFRWGFRHYADGDVLDVGVGVADLGEQLEEGVA
jgi:hypothetical protein